MNGRRQEGKAHAGAKTSLSRISTLRYLIVVILILAGASSRVFADILLEEYEGRLIATIEIAFENSPHDAEAEAEFLSLLKIAPNTEFSAVRVRDSLQSLFDSGRIANARVEAYDATPSKAGPLRLRFIIQRQLQISGVRIELPPVI